MRSLEWALIRYDWCPHKTRLGHRSTRQEGGLRSSQPCDTLMSDCEPLEWRGGTFLLREGARLWYLLRRPKQAHAPPQGRLSGASCGCRDSGVGQLARKSSPSPTYSLTPNGGRALGLTVSLQNPGCDRPNLLMTVLLVNSISSTVSLAKLVGLVLLSSLSS